MGPGGPQPRCHAARWRTRGRGCAGRPARLPRRRGAPRSGPGPPRARSRGQGGPLHPADGRESRAAPAAVAEEDPPLTARGATRGRGPQCASAPSCTAPLGCPFPLPKLQLRSPQPSAHRFPLRGHFIPCREMRSCFSPASLTRMVPAGPPSPLCRLWDSSTYRLLLVLPAHPSCCISGIPEWEIAGLHKTMINNYPCEGSPPSQQV